MYHKSWGEYEVTFLRLTFYEILLQPEGIAIEDREVLLNRAAQGTINFAMNK